MMFTFIDLLLILCRLLILTPSQMKRKNYPWLMGHRIHTALNPVLCALLPNPVTCCHCVNLHY